jgi:hypothetical protein
LVRIIAARGSDGLLALIAAAAAFVALAYATARRELERISLEVRDVPIGAGRLVAHAVALAVWIGLSQPLFSGDVSKTPAPRGASLDSTCHLVSDTVSSG